MTQPLFLIAHDIRSLHNVGSLFRSADCFGVDRLYLTGFTGTPPRSEIAKTALGSEDRVPWERREDIRVLLWELKSDGFMILALDNAEGAGPIGPREGKVALLLGNEVNGIDPSLRRLADETVEIFMPGRKRSLNVSVAAGIALFALHSSLKSCP